MNKNKATPRLIVIVGPTASGKSVLGIKLAQKYNGEIISADSRQVYRGMDIGTGKVTKKEQKMAKHHLIDVADPKKQFNASDFKKLAEKSIEKIIAKHKVPIIVGGTGFYIDILLDRMAMTPVPPNKKLRAELEKQSAEQLFERLKKLDPQRAKTIDAHNKRRLIRALEIVLTTGKPISKAVVSSKYCVLWLGINPGKEILAERIKTRLDKRLRQGMIKEVLKLHKNSASWKRLDDFGLEYRWISKFLQNKISRQEMEESLLRDIVKYSKRQMTWFKRNHEIHWIKDYKTAERLARRFIVN